MKRDHSESYNLNKFSQLTQLIGSQEGQTIEVIHRARNTFDIRFGTGDKSTLIQNITYDYQKQNSTIRLKTGDFVVEREVRLSAYYLLTMSSNLIEFCQIKSPF